MNYLNKIVVFIVFLITSAFTIPAPTEYTNDMLVQDLQGAALVALCEVVSLDTVEEGDTDLIISGVEVCVLKVTQTFKGGINSSDSLYIIRRPLSLTGGYEPDYRIGEPSIICFNKGKLLVSGDKQLYPNYRAKFDITENDSVLPPPTGLGFSDNLVNYSRTSSLFTNYISGIIHSREMLEYIPVVPLTETGIRFKTHIELLGGAQLVDSSLSYSGDTIGFNLSFMPCTSMACPDLYMLSEVTVDAGQLEKGNYTVERREHNLYSDEETLTEKVTFTVYDNSTETNFKRRQPSTFIPAAGRGGLKVYDLRGRKIRCLNSSAVNRNITGGVYIIDRQNRRDKIVDIRE